MSYLALKHLHLSLVVLSTIGFVLRGVWMLRGSALRDHRATRVMPHVVDTLLLCSGLALLYANGGVLLAMPWLHVKLTGLVAYVVLGSFALRRGKTRRVRVSAFLAALACLGWMASVAWLKTPWGFFSLLQSQG